jgi:hypothetical protein
VTYILKSYAVLQKYLSHLSPYNQFTSKAVMYPFLQIRKSKRAKSQGFSQSLLGMKESIATYLGGVAPAGLSLCTRPKGVLPIGRMNCYTDPWKEIQLSMIWDPLFNLPSSCKKFLDWCGLLKMLIVAIGNKSCVRTTTGYL